MASMASSPLETASTAPSSIGSSIQSRESLPDYNAPHVESFRWFDNVVFELNNVFLECGTEDEGSQRLKEIKYDILTSPAWSKFEKGLISWADCRDQLHSLFEVSEDDITVASAAAMSWHPSPEMQSLIAHLRGAHDIYAIGNLPQTVLESLDGRACLVPFARSFISCQQNERLPHTAMFSKMLESVQLDPERTLYIGYHIDSIITAQSFGFHAVQRKDIMTCVQNVKQICNDPIPKARAWLRANARKLDLITSLGITVKDAFQQYCILDATGDKSLVYYDKEQRLFSWYYGPAPQGLKYFPPDVDCNSLACSTLDHLDDATKHHLMDTMLRYVDSSGILQGYFSDEKVRVDILMCVNGLAIFNEYGRGHELAATEDFLYKVMITRAFRDGTHYYPSADVFLYFVSRMLRKGPGLRDRFGPVLRDCVLERKEAPGDALSLACRVIAAARCGIKDDQNMERLLVLQQADGSWEGGVIYQFTRVKGVAWHQGSTVALTVLAIEEWEALRLRK